MKVYITVNDPAGGVYGVERTPVTVSHRALYENGAFYGAESMRKLFPAERELITFLANAIKAPADQHYTYGTFTWYVERI